MISNYYCLPSNYYNNNNYIITRLIRHQSKICAIIMVNIYVIISHLAIKYGAHAMTLCFMPLSQNIPSTDYNESEVTLYMYSVLAT